MHKVNHACIHIAKSYNIASTVYYAYTCNISNWSNLVSKGTVTVLNIEAILDIYKR